MRIVQILETVYDHDCYDDGDGIIQTKIRYAVYLCGGSLKEYLIALTIYRLLLIYDSAIPRYHITEKGIRFLELYSKLGNMTKDENTQD